MKKPIIDVTARNGGRQGNAEIAAETMAFLKKGQFDGEPEKSIMYDEHHVFAKKVAPPAPKEVVKCVVEVTAETTLQALYRLGEGNSAGSTGCLNFASAKNPGGGFLKGSSAQEESLARSSSLYLSLIRFKKPFYEYNKRSPGVYTDRIIFSPRITFFKDDRGKTVPARVFSVITSPAVNAGATREEQTEISRLMRVRMGKVLSVAAEHGVRRLVLGAFGCGVFKNDPKVVAAMWKELLAEDVFRGAFDHIVFACYGPEENLIAFQEAGLEQK